MDLATSAKRLASLGHENRLELFQLLVQAGSEGMTIGELQAVLDRPASTLAFHLRELVSAGLVVQEKEGRAVRCHANYRALNEVLQFIKQDCCKGVALPVFISKPA
ncbi:metalloregulator ArsR/SmtB family transcription factor [Noviherbaspirillum sp.]|jgi:DNA-binding transcriptional ArsR family regulator|uniref:ArsR/SmtB family transcription factor n=1 Tax=unclassified Noviherbaspirillum TaxID=2617509 RepID=UPI0025F95014|nr:metalloregulator ArsR/SmtB family transcription factor [Noviherbaspirillum sp.]